ncbi:MAG: hypothetical protein H6830_00760 [Planctomycetes bacterium]|nr:hypothetical protein [Planctomycetota bacterium]MCB9910995.1 hypothetical protein [Planctomycetota bacterium]
MQPNDRIWQPWRLAQDWTQLCELTIQFLEGELEVFPGWMAREIDEETDPLVPELAAACRAGFLTTASQPGGCPSHSHDGLPWRQKAFVVGFAHPEYIEGLTQRCAGTRLVVLDYPAVEGGGESQLVAEQGSRQYLWVGAAQGPAELEIFEEYLAGPALRSLEASRYVCVIDPEWGQDDLLWPLLAP